MGPQAGRRIELPVDGRAAKRWAYEFHGEAISVLPPQIRHNIDWDLVASDLQADSPDSIPLDVLQGICRIVDFLVPSNPQCADVVHADIIDAVKVVKDWADRLECTASKSR